MAYTMFVSVVIVQFVHFTGGFIVPIIPVVAVNNSVSVQCQS